MLLTDATAAVSLAYTFEGVAEVAKVEISYSPGASQINKQTNKTGNRTNESKSRLDSQM